MASDDRPNILLVVSDQERSRGWIPSHLRLPARQRLIDEGLEFRSYYTHSSPCSPSRASLFTGLHVPQHGVTDNVIFPPQHELDPLVPTIGSRLRAAGYRTSYVGKWHLSHAEQPDMESYGFSDWTGNDRHYMGWAGTGWQFDPVIAEQAVNWLGHNGASGTGPERQPWLLTVALVNPHDVMWFPVDQPDYQVAHPESVQFFRDLLRLAAWKDDEPIPLFTEEIPRVFDKLPENFDDDLFTKPAVHRQWGHEQNNSFWGTIERDDTDSWLRHLDYYWRLHQAADESLARVLAALDASGAADDTVVVFTSDHGDMCGSHGLRAKGPFLYEEIMHIPLYMRAPGRLAAGATTDALASHVDLARTLVALGGGSTEGMAGSDLSPVLADPTSRGPVDAVMFAQDQAWYGSCVPLRYAMRGYYDGREKYARYYGVGGGYDQIGQPTPYPKRVDVDSAFEDFDHEWYDLQEDPHELVNLANDRSRRRELRERFAHLLELEAAHFAQ